MSGDVIAMSQKELGRLEVVAALCKGRCLQREAAQRLGLSVRQVKRLARGKRGHILNLES